MRVRRLRPVRRRRALPRARRREGRVLRRASTPRPTSSRSTCPRRPRPRAGSTPRRFAQDARTACASSTSRAAPLIVDEDLQAALDSGKVAGAALDVFRSEPITEHPLFGYPNVIVTPHLGASTAEATDRAGFQAAEQVVAALTGGSVTTAVNVPAVAAEDLEVLGPVPAALPRSSGGSRRARRAASIDRVEVEFLGRIAERDTPPARDRGAPRRARGPHRGGGQRGQRAGDRRASAGSRSSRPSARARATSPTSSASRSSTATSASAWSAPTLGRRNRPHLLEAWGQRFNLQLEDHLALFRYRDLPGHDRPRRHDASASTASTSPRPPSATPDDEQRRRRRGGDGRHDGRRSSARTSWTSIVAGDGFVAGRAVALS